MGLVQQLQFKYSKEDLLKLLDSLGYKKREHLYFKETDSSIIELAIEPYGLYIHLSGEYFYEFGLLIERLGEITKKVSIEDQ